MNKTVPIFAVSVLAALGAGGVFGYQYAKKELEDYFNARLEDETEELRRYYKKKYKTDEFATPEKMAESLGVIPSTKGARSGADIPAGPRLDVSASGHEVQPEVLERVVQKLRYDAPDPEEEWVRNSETAGGTLDKSGPSVITVEEFVANEVDHYQPSWTYYMGDDILMDEERNIVLDREDIIGRGSLECFGQGSNDIDIVYVRNTDLERDYEITRLPRKSNDPDPDDDTEAPKKRRHGNRSRV